MSDRQLFLPQTLAADGAVQLLLASLISARPVVHHHYQHKLVLNAVEGAGAAVCKQ
jgi:hypothetical protein